jgi:hypothetical protein
MQPSSAGFGTSLGPIWGAKIQFQNESESSPDMDNDEIVRQPPTK